MDSSVPSVAWSQSSSHDRLASVSPPAASAASPTRRLRGLSYLRSYTHNHLLSREIQTSPNSQRTSNTRTTPSPLPSLTATPSTSNGSPEPNPDPPTLLRQASPSARPRTTDIPLPRSSDPSNSGSAKGWLPTAGGHSGAVSSTATAAPAATLTSLSDLYPRPDILGSVAGMAQVLDGGGSHPQVEAPAAANRRDGSQGSFHQLPSIRFIAYHDPRAARPSLVFTPLTRILPHGNDVIRVGRYSERDNYPSQAVNVPSAAPVGFKSKVVSRRHCEFWYTGNRWFIKDVKSSSGTFLNHVRLSSPNTESRPFPVNDGDIVQLGIDFKGGEEMIFRCVKIRVELNKGWQNAPSNFNVESHKRLQELNNQGKDTACSSSQDCSICLGPIAPCQPLFVAPCSHTWHYKCIRVIINSPNWPHFICPNCRTVTDLEAELDDPSAWEGIQAENPNASLQASQPPETHGHPISNGSEDTNIGNSPTVEPIFEESDVLVSPRGDGLGQETNGDSELDHEINLAARSIWSLGIADSMTGIRPRSSNVTVPPVDIPGRNTVSSSSTGGSARPQNPGTSIDRDLNRTPSPNDLPSSMTHVVPGSEGPITPRNNAGPFIFDGSAGQIRT